MGHTLVNARGCARMQPCGPPLAPGFTGWWGLHLMRASVPLLAAARGVTCSRPCSCMEAAWRSSGCAWRCAASCRRGVGRPSCGEGEGEGAGGGVQAAAVLAVTRRTRAWWEAGERGWALTQGSARARQGVQQLLGGCPAGHHPAAAHPGEDAQHEPAAQGHQAREHLPHRWGRGREAGVQLPGGCAPGADMT